MTNDQKIAECLAMLGAGVALDPRDREAFNDHVDSMRQKPAKAPKVEAKKDE
jgi:hypothetical protein